MQSVPPRTARLEGQGPSRPAELLRKRTGTPLRLEQFAPLESAARGAGEVARQLEIVFAEDALLREEDDDEPSGLVAGRRNRYGKQRAVALAHGRAAPGLG